VLNLLDQLIRTVLDSGWTPAPPPAKPEFFFTVPDAEWQTKVKAGLTLRLNIYLYEVRENTNFRRPDWDAIPLPDRTVVFSRPPAWFDCHYLISAWSPGEDSEALNPVLDEHQVLGEALRVLMANPDVTPAALGVAGGGPVFQQAHVYLAVAPPDPPRVLNDFWSTMKLPWRPAIQVVATAPLDLLVDTKPAPPMITFVQRYLLIGATGAAEELVQIGGWVLRAADGTPVAGATVRRLDTGEQATTDAQGRYTFVGLVPGSYQVVASAPGLAALQQQVDVPAGPPDQHIFKLS
jgi:hypothetical protein